MIVTTKETIQDLGKKGKRNPADPNFSLTLTEPEGCKMNSEVEFAEVLCN